MTVRREYFNDSMTMCYRTLGTLEAVEGRAADSEHSEQHFSSCDAASGPGFCVTCSRQALVHQHLNNDLCVREDLSLAQTSAQFKLTTQLLTAPAMVNSRTHTVPTGAANEAVEVPMRCDRELVMEEE